MLAALALVAALAFASPGPAAAADVPSQLDIFDFQPNAAQPAELEIELLLSASAAPTAKAVFYVPPGWGVATSGAPGTQIGNVDATLLAGGASVPTTGKLFVDNPANYLTQTCAPGTHAAVWVAKLSLGGQAIDVPIYVDPATPDIAAAASFTMTACFAAPVGASGLRLGELDVELLSGISNPAATASHLWRVLVTPFGADGNPSLAGTTELQAIVPVPQHLTLSSRFIRKRHVVVLSGSVIAAGHPRAGVNVHFVSSATQSFAKIKTFGVAKTNGSGHFTMTKKVTASRYVIAYMNAYYSPACSGTISAAPCTTQTIGPPPPAAVHVVYKR